MNDPLTTFSSSPDHTSATADKPADALSQLPEAPDDAFSADTDAVAAEAVAPTRSQRMLPRSPTAVAPARARVPFPISRHSPFRDGYDIASERVALRDLADADDFDQAMLDPRFPRLEELQRRESLLRQASTQHRLRGGANPELTDSEAGRLQGQLGQLTDEDDDTMALHTRDAARLFMGRAASPEQGGYSQSGAKKVGAALRTIWYLSGNDNPYADLVLIEASQRIVEQVQALEASIAEMTAQLDALKRRGLSFSVLRADPPVNTTLGFRSPYGYSVVHLVSTFDYHVRLVRTLVRKDLMSDREGDAALHTRAKACRAIFERVVRYQNSLMHAGLRPLSRADWLPTADEAARKRVQAAFGLFGEVPREVLNGKLAPRHSRRRVDLSDEELRLLNAVPLTGADEAFEAAAARLVG